MNRKPDPYGRDATHPYHIPFKGWWQVAQRVWTESNRDNLSVVAAGCAFFALLAIFPVLSAVISVYGLTADPDTVEQNFGMLRSVLPPQAGDVVMDQIHRIATASGGRLGWSLVISMGIALWSALAGTQVHDGRPEYRLRRTRAPQPFPILFECPYLHHHRHGRRLGHASRHPLRADPVCRRGLSREFELVVGVGRWPFLALFVLFILSLLYRYGPCRRSAKWHWVSVGSLFAMVAWLIASAAFSLYVSQFANYDRIYGSLGAVVILMFWLYMSFYIVLLGAEINAELELQTAEDTTTGKPRPMGKRGAFVADHVAGGPGGEKRPVSPVTRDPAAAKPGGS